MWRLPSRHQVTNTLHRITLTRLCLSNHKLVIETGCYSRPFKKPEERICPICKIEVGDEYHFLNICPAYQEKPSLLLDYLEKEYSKSKTEQNVTYQNIHVSNKSP